LRCDVPARVQKRAERRTERVRALGMRFRCLALFKTGL